MALGTHALVEGARSSRRCAVNKLTLPTIHLNGTSAESLYEDLANALGAQDGAR